jgi:dihydropteroate synthase
VLPIHRQIWELGHSTHICGILNITPDSFSDGGSHMAGAAAAGTQHHASPTVHSQAVYAPPPPLQPQEQQDEQQQQESPAEQLAAEAAGDDSSSSIADSAAAAAGSNGSSSSSSYPAIVTGNPDVDVAGAVEAARAMARAGAQIIDVGGQSTRPGSQRLSAEHELARVLPVIR